LTPTAIFASSRIPPKIAFAAPLPRRSAKRPDSHTMNAANTAIPYSAPDLAPELYAELEVTFAGALLP
jgi:hypothetical protein